MSEFVNKGLAILTTTVICLSPAVEAASKKVSRVKPPTSSVDFGLAYGISSNLSEQSSSRSLEHSLASSVSYGSDKSWSARWGFALDYTYFSQDREIQVGANASSRAQQADWNAAELSLSFAGPFSDAWSGSVEGGGRLPLSETARLAGYRALPFLSGEARVQLSPQFVLGQSLRYTYIVNSYDVSPGSQKINPEHRASYRLVPLWNISRSVSLGLLAGLDQTRFLDGLDQINFTQGALLKVRMGQISTRFSYVTGGFSEPGMFELGYMDETRQILSAEIAYEL